jgi:hypothetical protein
VLQADGSLSSPRSEIVRVTSFAERNW